MSMACTRERIGPKKIRREYPFRLDFSGILLSTANQRKLLIKGFSNAFEAGSKSLEIET